MNIVRFNEPFESAIRAHVSKEQERLLLYTHWKTAPLFQYQTTMDKEKHLIHADLLATNMRLESAPWPYETFRLAVDQTSTGWVEDGKQHGSGRYIANYIVMRRHEQINFLGHIIRLYDETVEGSIVARKYSPLIISVADAYTTIDNAEEYTFQTATFAGGRWLKTDSNYLVQGLMDSLAGFILDSMIPTNHIAEVRPNEPGRSVEWVKARTHFTLITHGHPANKKSVREGTRIEANPADELKRMAGNRKGHYKTLKHPRYRFALNEKRFADKPKGTIYVKPCWCGPKEWQDAGGKQIYRILEPIE